MANAKRNNATQGHDKIISTYSMSPKEQKVFLVPSSKRMAIQKERSPPPKSSTCNKDKFPFSLWVRTTLRVYHMHIKLLGDPQSWILVYTFTLLKYRLVTQIS